MTFSKINKKEKFVVLDFNKIHSYFVIQNNEKKKLIKIIFNSIL